MPDVEYVLDAQEIFTLFFVTLGPIKLLGPFARATAALPEHELRSLALQTAAIAAATAVVGGFLSRAILANWGIPPRVLGLSAGLVLFVVAFRLVLQPYEAPASPPPGGTSEKPSAMKLVFPLVLTPYGIAAFVTLLALSSGEGRTAMIVGMLLVVMLLNFLVMAFVRPILRAVGPGPLQALGAVLGVLQLALAIQIILGSLRALGVLPSPG
jgi:multiple antibiotic resistance protein